MRKGKEPEGLKHQRAINLPPPHDIDTIHVSIKRDLARQIGLETIKEHLEEQVHLLYATHLKKQFDQALAESGIDNDAELEKARQAAWNEYKGDFLREQKSK
jgi:cation transport regulator ChaB